MRLIEIAEVGACVLRVRFTVPKRGAMAELHRRVFLGRVDHEGIVIAERGRKDQVRAFQIDHGFHGLADGICLGDVFFFDDRDPLDAAQEQVTQLASTLVLPLIGRVAAGSPILAQEHIDTTHSVPESMFERRPDYLLRVRGMSMRDLGILDGDLLAVQATQQARSGQIVVARLDDEVTVKRLELLPSGARLHPANPDYPIIEVRDAESFAIEGLAVGLVRPGL